MNGKLAVSLTTVHAILLLAGLHILKHHIHDISQSLFFPFSSSSKSKHLVMNTYEICIYF